MMGEEIHAQERSEIGQAPTETRGLFQAAQGQHRDQCESKLSFGLIRRGADEGLDLQILFDRLEEQLDLPTILVDRGDGAGTETVMFGDEQGCCRRSSRIASTQRRKCGH